MQWTRRKMKEGQTKDSLAKNSGDAKCGFEFRLSMKNGHRPNMEIFCSCHKMCWPLTDLLTCAQEI
uniref:Uncharacterized protein n=1 Tax=Arion vulgaris TaxID=1028688 RepID=A0A0B7B5L1_9EUPU